MYEFAFFIMLARVAILFNEAYTCTLILPSNGLEMFATLHLIAAEVRISYAKRSLLELVL